MDAFSAPLTSLFVYGTLLPGESRWHHLAPFVADDGTSDSVAGVLFDTGLGFPAAIFGQNGPIGSPTPSGWVLGRCFGLAVEGIDDALAHLDDVEGAADGGYRRVVVRTRSGREVWSYEYGGGLDLRPISSGSWLDHPHG